MTPPFQKRPVNYTLIGMPGVGKTTLGQKLAKKLDYDFVDTDKLIEAAHEKPLQSILDSFLADDNLKGFLVEERRIFRETKPYTHTIISTGGSFCYSPELLKLQKGIVVYLEISWELLKNRLKSFSGRGVVQLAPSLREEYLIREPLYKEFSDITVSCNHKTISELVTELQTLPLEGWEGTEKAKSIF